jgi:putative SOS response-associated peptidase YedK
MCGRFILKTLPPAWRRAFELEFSVTPGLQLRPRYNIAPGQDVLILRTVDDAAEAEPARWGLIPRLGGRPCPRQPDDQRPCRDARHQAGF